jgi:hypothetical protein
MLEALRAARGNGRPPSPAPGPVTNLAVVTLPGAETPLAVGRAPLITSHPVGLLAGGGLNILALTGRGNIDLGVYVDREQGEGGWGLLDAVVAAIEELAGTRASA